MAAYDGDDVAMMRKCILNEVPDWSVGATPLGLQPKDWIPHVVGKGNIAVLIHAVEELSGVWRERLLIAKAAGYRVVIAAPSIYWLSDETLRYSLEHHFQVIDLDDSSGAWVCRKFRSAAEMISRRRVSLAPGKRTEFASLAWNACKTASTNTEKGGTLEDFLLLLFEGIPDFEFFDRNVRTATEEIDLIFINRGTSGRVWNGSRIIVISAKNWTSTVGRREVSDLETYVRNRGQFCRIGLLCAVGNVSEEARIEIIRISREGYTISLLNGNDIEGLLASTGSLADDVERHIVSNSILI